MTGASLTFLGFAALAILVANVSNRATWRRYVILIFSLIFVGFCRAGQSLLPLAGFLALGYFALKLAESERLKTATPMVVILVVSYVWLKKYSFVPSSLCLPVAYATLGLSYIFFRVIHMVVDARNGALPRPVTLTKYLAYTLNFTTLVAGPIQRYQEFDESLRSEDRPSVGVVGWALERIILGLFKTNVLALAFSLAQNSALRQISTTTVWTEKVVYTAIVIAAYPFFLYCNFSGYIDIVIGVAKLMGLTLPENFDRPFSATSFIDFWNRWHITLSNWLKTYIYIPLVMLLMERYPSEALAPLWGVLAFFVTFFLVGAWHGQTSTFLFFGVLQGLGVSVNKLYEIAMSKALGRKRWKALGANPVYLAIARGLTFTWFAFTLLWFWSKWSELIVLERQVGWSIAASALAAIFVGATVLLALWEYLREALLRIRWDNKVVLESRYVRTAWCTALVLITITSQILTQQQAPEIVYKAF